MANRLTQYRLRLNNQQPRKDKHMNKVEALQAMKFYKEKLYNGIFNDKIEAFDVATEAIDKQIPKPFYKKETHDSECPSCGSMLLADIFGYTGKYCRDCGQRVEPY